MASEKSSTTTTTTITTTTGGASDYSIPSETLKPLCREKDAVLPQAQIVLADNGHSSVVERRPRRRFGQEILDKIWPISSRAKPIEEDDLSSSPLDEDAKEIDEAQLSMLLNEEKK